MSQGILAGGHMRVQDVGAALDEHDEVVEKLVCKLGIQSWVLSEFQAFYVFYAIGIRSHTVADLTIHEVAVERAGDGGDREAAERAVHLLRRPTTCQAIRLMV